MPKKSKKKDKKKRSFDRKCSSITEEEVAKSGCPKGCQRAARKTNACVRLRNNRTKSKIKSPKAKKRVMLREHVETELGIMNINTGENKNSIESDVKKEYDNKGENGNDVKKYILIGHGWDYPGSFQLSPYTNSKVYVKKIHGCYYEKISNIDSLYKNSTDYYSFVRSLINLEQNEKNGQQFVLLKSNQNIAVFNMLLTILPTFQSEFCGLFEFGSNKSIIHKLKLNNTFTLKQLFDKLGNNFSLYIRACREPLDKFQIENIEKTFQNGSSILRFIKKNRIKHWNNVLPNKFLESREYNMPRLELNLTSENKNFKEYIIKNEEKNEEKNNGKNDFLISPNTSIFNVGDKVTFYSRAFRKYIPSTIKSVKNSNGSKIYTITNNKGKNRKGVSSHQLTLNNSTDGGSNLNSIISNKFTKNRLINISKYLSLEVVNMNKDEIIKNLIIKLS